MPLFKLFHFSDKESNETFPYSEHHIKNCSHQACGLYSTILDGVIVDGLKQKGRSPLFFWGCVFRHVTLKNKITAPKINPTISLSPSREEIDLWKNSEMSVYKEVDWALDISNASFSTLFDIPGVPADLIRRDPESQIILRRENLLALSWKPTVKGDIWSVAISWFLESGYPDVVVVAGKNSPKYKQWKKDIKRLRDIGVADQD